MGRGVVDYGKTEQDKRREECMCCVFIYAW